VFYRLQAHGALQRRCSDDLIGERTVSPPTDTRAWLRGMCVTRFGAAISTVDWGRIVFREQGVADAPGLAVASPAAEVSDRVAVPVGVRELTLRLPDPLAGTCEQFHDALEQAATPAQLFGFFSDQ
jgi:hypothetical protein